MRNTLYALGILFIMVPTLVAGYYCYMMFYEWTSAAAKFELNLTPHGVDRSEHDN